LSYVIDYDIVARLGVAALGGLAVGVEREWSGHAAGPAARFAGVRTFLLLGILGGIAGWLAASSLGLVAAGLIAGSAALVVAAYVVAARRGPESIDGTTEAAALVVLALGMVAGLNHLAIASGATAVVVLALTEKTRLHAIVSRLESNDLRAAVHFAVLSLVILPLLPEGPYGPLGGLRPRMLWQIVLLFSALNFAGYVARKAFGQQRGYGVAGILGGVISSTAVTLTFARRSRDEPRLARSLAVGVIGACTMLLPRVTIVAAVLQPRVAAKLAAYLAPAFLVGLGLVVAAIVHRPRALETAAPPDGRSPLRLTSAVQMAVAFQVVLMAIVWIQEAWGAQGVLTSAAVLGLTDVDALTVAMSRLGEDASRTTLAAQAIVVGIIANTALKLTLALVLGTRDFRRPASLGMTALAAAIVVGLWVGTSRQAGGFLVP
jgi:uncharacterized membrane protein (DUF4010 family)